MAAAPIVLGITIRADGSSQVQGELNNIRTGLNNAGTAANQTNREFADMARETLGLGNALKGLAAGLSVMAMYQSAKDIIMLADKMTLLDSRIKIATKSIDDYRAASAALTQISLATGASLESNVVMFGRLNKSVEASGGTYKTTLGLVETLNEGLKISGASAGEASSVMIQLSQALSSGVLRGDEFNSIMENGSRIVEALTTATGKTRGELRALAADGKLTSEIVIGAMQQQADAIHKDFSAIPLTIGAALENINTSFSRYIENLNKSSGATSSFAQSLNGISKNLDPIISGIVTLGEVAATVFAGQLVASMGSYVTAKYAAIAMERAHSAALMMNAEMSAAATAAQIANTRAMLAGDVSMGARMALTNQLNILIAEQTAATLAASAATLTFAQSMTRLLSPINLVNIGLAGLVGWEIGGFLNKFESVRRVANDVLYSVVTALEYVSYQWDKFNAKSTEKAGIESAHSAQTAMISDLISETNSYVKSGDNAAAVTTAQGTALKAFSVDIDETTKKHKAKKEALTEEQKAAKAAVDELQRYNEKVLASLQGMAEARNEQILINRGKTLEAEISKNLSAMLGHQYDVREQLTQVQKDSVAAMTAETTETFKQTEAIRIQNAMWEESIRWHNELKDIQTATTDMQQLAVSAEALHNLGVSNEEVKKRIDLEKTLNAEIKAHPDQDPQLITDSVIARQKASDTIAKYTDTNTSKSSEWMAAAFKKAAESIQTSFASMFENMLNGDATASFAKFADNIRKTLNQAISQQLALDLQGLFSENGSIINVLKSGLLFAFASIGSLFKKTVAPAVPSPAMTYAGAPSTGIGAMAIADSFSRDRGYEYQSQTVMAFNKSLDNLSSSLMTAFKVGIEQFGTQLSSLSVVSTVSNFLKPLTSVVEGVYQSASKLVADGLASVGSALGLSASAFAETVSASWSAGIAASTKTVAGAYQATEAAATKVGETALSSAMKVGGQVLAVVGAIYSVVTYFTGLGDMIKRDNAVEIIGTSLGMVGAVITAAAALM